MSAAANTRALRFWRIPFCAPFSYFHWLRQKDNIGNFVLEKLKEHQDELCVAFLSAGLKNIILPGEIRDIMNRC